MPEDSIAPLVTAIVLTGLFAGLLVQWWWVAIVFGVLSLASLIIWLWPEPQLAQMAVLADE